MIKRLEPVETAEEMLSLLEGERHKIALMLHEFGQSKDLKIEPRTGAYNYRISYYKEKPKRVIFTTECKKVGLRVKAPLYHLSEYSELLCKSDADVLKGINATRSCTECNAKCKGGAQFSLFGEKYHTCIGSGHFFTEMSSAQWELLLKLLERELEYDYV